MGEHPGGVQPRDRKAVDIGPHGPLSGCVRLAIHTASAKSMPTEMWHYELAPERRGICPRPSPMRRPGDGVPESFFKALKREQVYLHDD
jgi:hypothetical protein